MSVLSLQNLSIHAWGTNLVNKRTLDLKAGELLAIIGPNGAGKTSLINTIVNAGHKGQVVGGELRVCGHPYHQWSPKHRARQLAVLPQFNTLNFPFTVNEVVQLGRMPHQTGVKIDADIIEAALEALDISHLKQRLYTQLSGGEKQRVQLARVMTQVWRSEDACSNVEDKDEKPMNNQRLLLLDEPTSSLDLGHQKQLMKVVRRFADQGVAIIIVVHDVNLAANYADQLLALCCGNVIAQGKPENVITPALIKNLYQVDTTVLVHPNTNKPVVL